MSVIKNRSISPIFIFTAKLTWWACSKILNHFLKITSSINLTADRYLL